MKDFSEQYIKRRVRKAVTHISNENRILSSVPFVGTKFQINHVCRKICDSASSGRVDNRFDLFFSFGL